MWQLFPLLIQLWGIKIQLMNMIKLAISVVIGTDCIGSCKSNYHMNPATTAPILHGDAFYNIKWKIYRVRCTTYVIKFVSDLVFSGFLYQWNWDIVESGIKHQKPTIKQTNKNPCKIFWLCAVVYLHFSRFIGRGNQRKPSHWQTLSHMLYTSPWMRIKLAISVVIGTDCIGSCKSNYHMNPATTAPILHGDCGNFSHFWYNYEALKYNLWICKQWEFLPNWSYTLWILLTAPILHGDAFYNIKWKIYKKDFAELPFVNVFDRMVMIYMELVNLVFSGFLYQ
jgi:hypothetical protein